MGRGSKDHVKRRILRSASRAHDNGGFRKPRMLCRILTFMWSVGPLQAHSGCADASNSDYEGE